MRPRVPHVALISFQIHASEGPACRRDLAYNLVLFVVLVIVFASLCRTAGGGFMCPGRQQVQGGAYRVLTDV